MCVSVCMCVCVRVDVCVCVFVFVFVCVRGCVSAGTFFGPRSGVQTCVWGQCVVCDAVARFRGLALVSRFFLFCESCVWLCESWCPI